MHQARWQISHCTSVQGLTFGRNDLGDPGLLDQMANSRNVFERICEFFQGWMEDGCIGHAYILPVHLMEGTFQGL